jgi:hypothetical protein
MLDDTEAKPNQALSRAAKRYKKRLGKSSMAATIERALIPETCCSWKR